MATKDEFQKFIALLVRVVPRYAPNFDAPTTAAWYAEFGQEATRQQLEVAFQTVARTSHEFPSVAELRQAAGLGAPQSAEDIGRDVGALLIKAISTVGSIVGTGPAAQARRAKVTDIIGAVGEKIVGYNGGWNAVCEMVDNRNLPTLKAQWRSEGESIARSAKAGRFGPPELAGSTSSIPGMADLLKKFPSP